VTPGKDPTIPDNTQQPMWEEQPDGSRVRLTNGIRIVDRSTPRADLPPGPATEIEHLVTWQEDGGRMVILGLDADRRPVYTTTLFAYL
jgi:hypothetical protein